MTDKSEENAPFTYRRSYRCSALSLSLTNAMLQHKHLYIKQQYHFLRFASIASLIVYPCSNINASLDIVAMSDEEDDYKDILKSAKAKNLLVQCVDDSILENIMGKKTAHEMWETLKVYMDS